MHLHDTLIEAIDELRHKGYPDDHQILTNGAHFWVAEKRFQLLNPIGSGPYPDTDYNTLTGL